MNEKPSKRKRFKAFILQRKLNTLNRVGIKVIRPMLVITMMSAIITLICALKGFARTDVLVIVTVLLVVLCFIQSFKLKKSFRTIHHFKGSRHRSHEHASASGETSEG